MRAQGTAAVESSPVPRLLFVSRAQPPPPLDGAPPRRSILGSMPSTVATGRGACAAPDCQSGHVKPSVRAEPEPEQRQRIQFESWLSTYA